MQLDSLVVECRCSIVFWTLALRSLRVCLGCIYCLCKQRFFFCPGPPNLVVSLQNLHFPQSSFEHPSQLYLGLFMPVLCNRHEYDRYKVKPHTCTPPLATFSCAIGLELSSSLPSFSCRKQNSDYTSVDH